LAKRMNVSSWLAKKRGWSSQWLPACEPGFSRHKKSGQHGILEPATGANK
jgi:hypothetical protein